MDRTTLSLPDETRRRLRRLAAERGVSMAALIREAIEEKVGRLAALPPKPRSLGIGASGTSNTARRSGEEPPEPRSWR